VGVWWRIGNFLTDWVGSGFEGYGLSLKAVHFFGFSQQGWLFLFHENPKSTNGVSVFLGCGLPHKAIHFVFCFLTLFVMDALIPVGSYVCSTMKGVS